MIARDLENELKKSSKQLPVVGVLGPRQSGKTTLVKAVFAKHKYVNLEDPALRELATSDPRTFLKNYLNDAGLVIDEVQYAPQLFSYIQLLVDEEQKPGRIIITGSQNFLLNERITQSLAGRIAILTLLPLSVHELKSAKLLPKEIDALLFQGGYPRIYAQKIDPIHWYPDYIQTYVERDVRQLLHITHLSEFKRFLQLCAGRVGQILNITSLANDCGITTKTARAWLSILEASYILFLLQPHHANFSKRLIKSPKIYFYDTGLACSLLGITSEKSLFNHYLRGGLFESFVISELIKWRFNHRQRPQLYFWRNRTGNEVDCIVENGTQLTPVEIKYSRTINSQFFKGLNYWNDLAQADPRNGFVVYAGDEPQYRSTGNVISWQAIEEIFTGPKLKV